jgi:Ca2+/H+ antiporter, TMEM165/GDT1 family
MSADAIGIVVSVVLCRRIPERTVKLISAGAFVVFGFIGGFQVLDGRLALPLGATIGILAAVAAVTAGVAVLLIRANRPTENEVVAEYCAVRRSGDDEGLYEPLPRVESDKDGT